MSYFTISVFSSNQRHFINFSLTVYIYYSIPPIVLEEKSKKVGKQRTKPQRHWGEEAGGGKRDWLDECGNERLLNGGDGQFDAAINGERVVCLAGFRPWAIPIAVKRWLCIPKSNVAWGIYGFVPIIDITCNYNIILQISFF